MQKIYVSTEEKLSHVFYCDPSASWQKGAIEKNHEFIRYILPKGCSFDELTQEKTNWIMNHIDINKNLQNSLEEHFGDDLNIYTEQDLYEKSRKVIQTYKENYLQYNKYKRYYSED